MNSGGLAVERLRLVRVGLAVDDVVPPQVAASVHGTSVSVRLTTSTCSIVGVFTTAWSVFAFIGSGLPRRYCRRT